MSGVGWKRVTNSRALEAWLPADARCAATLIRRCVAAVQSRRTRASVVQLKGSRGGFIFPPRKSGWSLTVMPNHAHLLLTPNAGHELSAIQQSLKSYTANEANKILGRTGQFWQPEAFDRWIRDADHFAKTIAYIENNPVKARLCKRAEDWLFSSAWFRKRGKK